MIHRVCLWNPIFFLELSQGDSAEGIFLSFLCHESVSLGRLLHNTLFNLSQFPRCQLSLKYIHDCNKLLLSNSRCPFIVCQGDLLAKFGLIRSDDVLLSQCILRVAFCFHLMTLLLVPQNLGLDFLYAFAQIYFSVRVLSVLFLLRWVVFDSLQLIACSNNRFFQFPKLLNLVMRDC